MMSDESKKGRYKERERHGGGVLCTIVNYGRLT